MIAFKAYSKPVYRLTFTPDGRGLVTGSQVGVTLWDITAVPAVVRSYEMADCWLPSPVAVSPCGRFLARSGKQFELIELHSGRVVAAGLALARSIAFSPDGTEVAMTRSDQPVLRWAVPSGLPLPGGWGGSRSENNGRRFPAGALAYSPDGATLAVTYGVLEGDRFNSHIVMFDRQTGKPLGNVRVAFKYDHPERVAYSPDGTLIAGNFGPVLGVVSVADGTVVAQIKPGTKHFKDLAFTPTGTHLVAVSNDERVRVYDTRTWHEVHGFDWKVGKLGCVAVAPDGLRMAAGSGTGKVVIWDVDL